MRIAIGTTTGFHLRRLAIELSRGGQDVDYWAYTPAFRMRQEGLGEVHTRSLFRSLLPGSALALTTGAPWQMRSVEIMLARTDNYLRSRLLPSEVFIGLSAMAVRSAARARDLGSRVLIDRGSRHVLSQDELVSAQGGRPLSRNYIARELASYEQADSVTVLSEHAAQSFVDQGWPREKVFVCHLGVDLSLFRPTARRISRPTRLLFVGNWSHRKGADLLNTVLNRTDAWQLTHVGTVDRHDQVPTHPRVTHLGPKSHAELSKIMGSHHMLVLPSREDGFGMVLLEALASGLPVVASLMTGGPDIRKIIDHPEWVELVEPGDSDDLARGIAAMVERENQGSSSARDRLTDRDKSYFSWQAYGRRYQAHLDNLLGADAR